ncbi:MAG: hypothetical protein J0H17_22675 [Rhizobiales bacterium]|nr:hypothetical protein [Hyphomicrobiales bacterium]
MAISFPRTFPDELGVGGWTFPPLPMAEITPLRSGKQISKDLGPTLWKPTWKSVPLTEAKAGAVRAWYDTLTSIGEFYGYDKLRQYPLAYASGWGDLTVSASPFDGSGRLTDVAVNNVEITLDQLPIGFILSPGDYLAFNYLSGAARALHRVSAQATANGSGVMTVEVRPHIRAGWDDNAEVMLYRPSARMVILPGTYSESIEVPMLTSISFEAIQTL